MKTIIPVDIFPIEDDGYHLKINMMVNGKLANMILDTGASRTVFDEKRLVNFVKEGDISKQDRLSAGLGTNTMESKQVVLDKVQLGTIFIKDYNAAVLDLTHVNQSYQRIDLDAIDGVLGGDLLFNFGALIDYEEKTLILTEDSEK